MTEFISGQDIYDEPDCYGNQGQRISIYAGQDDGVEQCHVQQQVTQTAEYGGLQ